MKLPDYKVITPEEARTLGMRALTRREPLNELHTIAKDMRGKPFAIVTTVKPGLFEIWSRRTPLENRHNDMKFADI